MVQDSFVNLTETNRDFFPVGTVLEYSCDPGYLPNGPTILTCTALGLWSSEPPQCILSGCKRLPLALFSKLSWGGVGGVKKCLHSCLGFSLQKDFFNLEA